MSTFPPVLQLNHSDKVNVNRTKKKKLEKFSYLHEAYGIHKYCINMNLYLTLTSICLNILYSLNLKFFFAQRFSHTIKKIQHIITSLLNSMHHEFDKSYLLINSMACRCFDYFLKNFQFFSYSLSLAVCVPKLLWKIFCKNIFSISDV